MHISTLYHHSEDCLGLHGTPPLFLCKRHDSYMHLSVPLVAGSKNARSIAHGDAQCSAIQRLALLFRSSAPVLESSW